MRTITEIDTLLDPLFYQEKINLYQRWKSEYKQRYYQKQAELFAQTKPKEHSSYPGFEKNLLALAFKQMFEKDPHSEWPYASQLADSSEKVDIHLIFENSTQLWIEIGMYASDQIAKYSKDFHKLLSVVNIEGPNNIGVLVHFEIYEKNVVFKIFKDFCTQYQEIAIIDYKEFKTESKLVGCRLIISNKNAEPGAAH